ncbi:MAG: hypothetical protein LC790_22135, partial [Actinobacteria bacterium]|nr:hypothetical protein [Actinomycetota bacterium]
MSSGFYHRIAFALPFGLASTHAGVWQCRPAVTLSGRSTCGARFRAVAVPSFTGLLHRPGAGIPTGTDETFDVLHLLSHGASWRTINFYGRFYRSELARPTDQRLLGSLGHAEIQTTAPQSRPGTQAPRWRRKTPAGP